MKRCERCDGHGFVLDGATAREIRRRANLTQGQVAERMGVSIGYISNLERGTWNFRGERMLDFLRATGSTAWLTTAKKHEKP